MSELDVGANRHEWETRFAQIEEDAAGEPVDALAELTGLVEEMLVAAGYRPSVTEASSGEPEVVGAVAYARELLALNEAGEEVRHDDAQAAAAELRELYRELIEHPEADARAGLELGNP
jgi:hypothetical protein